MVHRRKDTMTLSFEPITPADFDEIRGMEPKGWPDIIPDIKLYVSSGHCKPIRTRVEGTIAGIGTAIFFRNTAWLAHIIVDERFRRRGIGARIVKELLSDIRSRSIESWSLIATDMGKPLYMREGFRTVTDYVFMERTRAREERPVSGNVIAFREEHRERIHELDGVISGEKREWLLRDYLGDAMVYCERGEISGYYMPAFKEGLIFAETEAAGLELLKLRCAKADKAVLPVDNVAGMEFLTQNGFAETGQRAVRMILGRDLDWRPANIYSRIGGNFG